MKEIKLMLSPVVLGEITERGKNGEGKERRGERTERIKRSRVIVPVEGGCAHEWLCEAVCSSGYADYTCRLC
jgi:hypothetical protein